MLDRSVLAEYEDACRLVEETESDLISLRRKYEHNAVDIVKGSNSNFPYEPRSFRIEGVDYGEYRNPNEIRELEAILSERRRIAREKRVAVEAWINTVPSRIARIVRLKYFKKMNWFDVSGQLGSASPDAARMELARYLKEISENNKKN